MFTEGFEKIAGHGLSFKPKRGRKSLWMAVEKHKHKHVAVPGWPRGHRKHGAASIVPRQLQNMTGARATEIFGKPIRRFASVSRLRPLLPFSRLRDGIR